MRFWSCVCVHMYMYACMHTLAHVHTHTHTHRETEKQKDTQRGGKKEKGTLIKLYSKISVVAKCLTLMNIRPSYLAVMEEEMDAQHKRLSSVWVAHEWRTDVDGFTNRALYSLNHRVPMS